MSRHSIKRREIFNDLIGKIFVNDFTLTVTSTVEKIIKAAGDWKPTDKEMIEMREKYPDNTDEERKGKSLKEEVLKRYESRLEDNIVTLSTFKLSKEVKFTKYLYNQLTSYDLYPLSNFLKDQSLTDAFDDLFNDVFDEIFYQEKLYTGNELALLDLSDIRYLNNAFITTLKSELNKLKKK